MTGMPGAAELPPEFWDTLKYAASESARLYPYLTLFTICTFGLLFITIPVMGYAYTAIRKEQIRCGYLEKKDKANVALKKLSMKAKSATNHQKKPRKHK